MSDSKLDPVLLMFHQIRREIQVRDKLYNKFREYSIKISNLTEAITMFSPWKKRFILIRDNLLYLIIAVRLSVPSKTDMKPSFEYEVCPIRKDREGNMLVNSGSSFNITPNHISSYLLATDSHIAKADIDVISGQALRRYIKVKDI